MFIQFKKILPHVLVLIGFVAISLAYFSPVLEGKKIFQSDIMHYNGMAKQQRDFAKTTGETTYWTNSAFGGMPTFQLGAQYAHNYIKKLDLALRFLPRPADYLFLYFAGFYLLLLTLKANYKIAAFGALAFGFSTYLIIILGVGHNSKAHAIAYMPFVLSGIFLVFQKKYISGFLLTTVALGLEIVTNHYQMTYYLLLLVLVLGLVKLMDAYKTQTLQHFYKAITILATSAALAVGLNATNLLATNQYVKDSTRGKTELTISANGAPKKTTEGLTKAYITEYSYGIAETFNLFIPKFMGGGNYENIGKDSETYKAYINLGASPIDALEASKNAPMYWGSQPIVEAPAYVGAVIIFLFVLGLFLVKGHLKWWLLSGSILSLLLSYGKNLELLTHFFIDYVPLYDKFRAVSSIQVILELCVPILGALALVALSKLETKASEKLNALKYSVIILAGLCVVFLVFKSQLFDFEGLRDDRYVEAYGPEFVKALIKDRQTLFSTDTIRSLILVLSSAGLVFFYLKEKINQTLLVITLAMLVLFDMISINKQYVNNDNFVSAINVDRPYKATSADKEILKDTTHFRVFDMSRQGQNQPARAAYFHNSILGYHAAKLGRYNDILEFYIYKNNMNVLNMLNTKYLIVEQDNTVFPYQNPDANGNAWFIETLDVLEDANAEIKALDSLNTKTKAVTTLAELATQQTFKVDGAATIDLQIAKPNYLKYTTNNTNNGFAVFSEIYYKNGWNAYINGALTAHTRVNYILRGLQIPKGEHTIEFKFEPKVVKAGQAISLASSICFIIIALGALFYRLRLKLS